MISYLVPVEPLAKIYVPFGCQTEIAGKIVEGKADCVLAVKGNQPGTISAWADKSGQFHRWTLRHQMG